MNITKVATGVFCSFIAVLFILIFLTERPEEALYKKTVKSIMIREELKSFQAVADSFPEIREVKSKINRAAYLREKIHRISGGPAPNVSKNEGMEIKKYTLEIHQLQRSIKEDLSKFIHIYSADLH